MNRTIGIERKALAVVACFLKEMFFMEMTSWMDGVEMETVEIYTVI